MVVSYSGIAGVRGYNPTHIVYHNDAGSQAANASFYKRWLESHNPESGFAHYYVGSDGTFQAEYDWNKAWHTGNTVGNRDYIGIEICQSMGDEKTFRANEQKAFKLGYDLCKKYNIPIVASSFPLHKELSGTSCPHRSWDLHGKSIQALKQYYADETLKAGGQTSSAQTNSFNINNYHTKKFAMIRLVIDDYAYKEPALINRAGSIVKKGTILTVVDLVYSGQYPRFKLKSGLYISTKKTIVEEYKQGTATTKPAPAKPTPKPQQTDSWIKENGTYTLSHASYLRTGATTSASSLGLMPVGTQIKYDAFAHLGGYVWIRQPRSNGYGYMATGNSANGKRTSVWGTFH